MNKNIILALVSLSLISCDAPRDRRSAWSGQSDSDYSTSGGNFVDSSSDSTRTSDSNTDNATDTSSSVVIPDEIKHCKWSMDGVNSFDDYDNTHLGVNTICQSTASKQDIYIQVKTPIIDSQVCFIPLISVNGVSKRAGNPRCQWLKDNKKIYKYTLYTNRSGYTGKDHLINSVMVLRDKKYGYGSPFNQYLLAPDAYIYCDNFNDLHNYSGYCDAFKKIKQYKYKPF